MREQRLPSWIIEVKIIKKSGRCAVGHKVGDRILITGCGIKGKICFSALCSMIPKVYGLRYGAELPWLQNLEAATHRCPDIHNNVVFELRRKELDKVE